MGTAPVFASAAEALEVVRAGLRFVAAADATQMTAAERAGCLRDLEKAHSVATAARTTVLGAFGAGQDYADDGDYSACSWLRYRTRVTPGTAKGHSAWVKRLARHRAVHAALGAEAISESYAWTICSWTDKLPEDARAAADEILLGAAAAGLALADLAGLAGEMYERSRQDKPDGEGPDGEDDDPGRDRDGVLDDRSVTLATTIGGAGVLRGDLTPECAEFVQAVLDALSAPAGADDGRSHGQRYHDGLQEAMRRLIAAGLVPERAGAAVNVLAYVSLADLMLIEGSSALLAEWTSGLRARWAGHRAAAEAGGHQGLWLDGDAAQGIACDASVTPVVVGDVNAAAFGDLVRLCVELGRLRHGAARSRAALVQAIIGQAVALLSGPGGLAGFLRREQLDARLAGPGLPLDIGYSNSVPAHIRKAVRLRARGHCEWAGGCSQPAAGCQVHHVKHLADGGPTSLTGCVLLCHFHHQVMIHQRGWTLVVNPDGTTTAWNKDKTKVLHSHGPPARAG